MPNWPESTASAPPRNRVMRIAAVLVLVVGGGIATWWISTRRSEGRSPAAGGTGPGAGVVSSAAALSDTSAHAPGGTRVIVRVINATGVRGLARKATLWLRDFGYDVVDFDSAPKLARTETLIEVHSGHADWGERVRKALGTGRVTTRPDTSRYVDLTVFIGSDWQPPAEPLRP